MITRNASFEVKKAAQSFPIVAITGPRQSGKTTLAQSVFSDRPYVSFENPDIYERFNDDPRGFLKSYEDGAIFDEAQKVPELFSYLQQVVDGDSRMGRFILTGSSQFDLFHGITQSLAGRVVSLHLLPFSYDELSKSGKFPAVQKDLNHILFNGLYPPIWDRKPDSSIWYGNYIHNYVERDVRKLLNISDLNSFQRFIRLCAARTGQLVNFSEIASAAGVSHNTIKSWISILEASYIVFLLKPYFNNYSKRLVKTPKLYFYDPGLICWLLSIQSVEQLDLHPMRGAIFESFVVSEILKQKFNSLKDSNIYFWRDRSGMEIDLLEDHGLNQTPIEIKSGQTFMGKFTKGVKKWESISGSTRTPIVIYGGEESFAQAGCKIQSWTTISHILYSE